MNQVRSFEIPLIQRGISKRILELVFLQGSIKSTVFKSSELVMDISEIKIHDDDLIFGRIKFNEDEHALEIIQQKINHDEGGHLTLSNFSSYLDNNSVSEVGNGMVDFFIRQNPKENIQETSYILFLQGIPQSI